MNQPSRREWTFRVDPETGQLDRDAIARRLIDLEAVLDAVGGGFTAVAIRQEIAPGEFATVGWAIKWESFVPTVGAAASEDQGAAS